MPSVLTKSLTLRCPRCATVLRNRSLCPSCGRDLEQPSEQEAETLMPISQQPAETAPIKVQQPPASPEPQPAASRVPPKPSLTLCAMCLSSVPAGEIQTRDGKSVCTACAQVMSKPAAPAPVHSAPVPAEIAARPAPARRPSPPTPRGAGPGTSEPPLEELKFNRYHEEQLKKKLGWVKFVLLIGGVVLALTGGGTYLLGDLSSKAAGSESVEDQALEMMEEAGSSAEENAARKQEQAEVRAAFQQAGQHLKMVALVQLMLAGVFITMIFLTNTYPFEISLAALLLYVGLEAWSVVSEGELPGLMSCLIVLVIAGNLAAGVHAGWQIRALRAAK